MPEDNNPPSKGFLGLLRQYLMPIFYLFFGLILIAIYQVFFVLPEDSERVKWAEEQFNNFPVEKKIKALIDFKNGKGIEFNGGLGSYTVQITESNKALADNPSLYQVGPEIKHLTDSLYFNMLNGEFITLKNLDLKKVIDGHVFVVSNKDEAILGVTEDFKKIINTNQVISNDKSIVHFNRAKKLLIVTDERKQILCIKINDNRPDSTFQIKIPQELRLSNCWGMNTTTYVLLRNPVSNASSLFFIDDDLETELQKIDFEFKEDPWIEPFEWEDGILLNIVQGSGLSLKSTGLFISKCRRNDGKKNSCQINTLYDFNSKASVTVNAHAKRCFVDTDTKVVVVEVTGDQREVKKNTSWEFWGSQGNNLIFSDGGKLLRYDLDHGRSFKIPLMKSLIDLIKAQPYFPTTDSLQCLIEIDQSLPYVLLPFFDQARAQLSQNLKFDERKIDIELRLNPYVAFIILTFVLAFGSLLRNFVLRYAIIRGKTYPANLDGQRSLKMKIVELDEVIHDLKLRYNSMLFLGLAFAILGIGGALLILQSTVDSQQEFSFDESHVYQVIRVFLTLVLVESLAFFFLRQYRVIFNEYKLFYSVRMKMLSYLSVLDLRSHTTVDKDTKDKLTEVWLKEEFSLYNGELNSTNDYPRAFKEILDTLGGKIIDKAKVG